MCGYVCCNCGKCRGESTMVKPFGTCFLCGFANDPDAKKCAACGAKLVAAPGKAVK